MQSFWQRPLFHTLAIFAVITWINGVLGFGTMNISLLLSGVFGYIALTKKRRFPMWVALIFLFIACMTMPVVRVIVYTLIVGVVVYSVYSYSRAQRRTKLTSLHYTPHTKLATPSEDYQWHDYIVQRAVGNVHIDLTKTILPTGTSFVSVRHGVGKITVIVPFEIGLRIQASTFFGATAILDEPRKTVNETVMYEEGTHLQRIVVLHMMSVAGEIEVIRA